MKLFSLMRGIFGKPASSAEADAGASAEAVAYQSQEAGEPSGDAQPYAAAEEVSAPVEESPAACVDAAPEYAPSATESPESALVLPLSSIVSSLPVELQQRIRSEMVGQAQCAFALDSVLPQLAQGAVRISFGNLRQCAPDAFAGSADRDFVMINLPLNEIVGRLTPAMFATRARKQVEVPEDITSPFGPNGQGLAIGRRPSSQDTSTTSRPRSAQSAVPSAPAADARNRGNVSSVPRPATPGGTSLFPKPTIQLPKPAEPSSPPVSAPPAGLAPLNGGFHKPPIVPSSRPSNNGNGSHGTHPPFAPSAAAGNADLGVIVFRLADVASALPEALRLEIAHLNAGGSSLAVPADQIEAGLRSGKLVFTWKQLRAWLKPAVPPTMSMHDNLAVSLPLAVIAPLFVGRLKSQGGAQKRVVVDEQIPNLFFGFPQPEAPVETPAHGPAAVPSAPSPAETNYFVWDDENEKVQAPDTKSVKADRGASGLGATNFTSRKATPNEIVTRASLLEGVYGALVALPDGLLVAAKLDPSVNGETVAALIPQMYSKLSGCTKELRMGELNNLNFTVGNVPWKIFRVNGIFFAAFGCAGEPLPTAQIASLASELDYKKAQ